MRIASFEKVSRERFIADLRKSFPDLDSPEQIYEEIRLPRRATAGSAGYDFYTTVPIHLLPQQTILIPTGIRALIDPGYVLLLFPRSSLGFKYRFQLDNSVGVIDSDYAMAENEGHIFLRMTNDSLSGKTLDIRRNEAVAQGIFLPFGLTMDDDATGVRHGGFGSTNRKE
ncbi:MAG: deoxyuridine 5'-triphosphate nucleotidohydrolase [Clostridia bacterium]|nr:deoxyuridine 5'-triphosphate nucleotidohydrolase [Clostridia bacterium]